ncbi:MAG: DNA repair protein RecN, partial [Spirochaetales bacterium]|nr:DNA repair protein RecN [Spirochaetales bacterium]
RLEIHNYALIEDSVIEFDDHFTVISGETGAGKSIILGALSLLLGQRADAQAIRSGTDSATVAASFYLEHIPGALAAFLARESLHLEEQTLIIRRTIKANGRSSVSIAGAMATLADLGSITTELFDISAQRDHQSLLSPAKQLAVLDAYGQCEEQLSTYRAAYDEHQRLIKAHRVMVKEMEQAQREADYLRFSIDEIAQVDPKAGEDEELAQEAKVIASAEQLHEAVHLAVSHLHDSSAALPMLHQAHQEIKEASKIDSSLSTLAQRLDEAYIEVQDIYESLRDYLGQINFSATELDRLQSRLALLQRLKKKYGPTLDAVITFYEDGLRRLELGEEGEVALKELEGQIERANELMLIEAEKLSVERKKAAKLLQSTVEEKLQHLGMQQARFEIAFEQIAPTSVGIDAVNFEICANPGMDLLPIKAVASGGELSRIMLAVKTSLAAADEIPTLIFDEVDAGIGGSVALAVAQQLQQLGQTHQVVVITHLASIASRADRHLVVHKEIHQSMSRSHITAVEDEARRREIARMLSGDAQSSESLDHASKLLAKEAGDGLL